MGKKSRNPIRPYQYPLPDQEPVPVTSDGLRDFAGAPSKGVPQNTGKVPRPYSFSLEDENTVSSEEV